MRIGVTEAGDAGIDLSWVKKLDSVEAAVIITKMLTPGCKAALLQRHDKLILHNTITGYGKTVLEPQVWDWKTSLDNLKSFCDQDGFPKQQVVVRVDPIIPTAKGTHRAEQVLRAALDAGFERFRVSVIDMYPHVRARFQTAGLPLPYLDGFSPTQQMLDMVDKMLEEIWWDYPGISIESCAERLSNAIQTGCVSAKDLDILHIPHGSLNKAGPQRSGCLCCSGKTELLETKKRCPNNCLYCYWRD